MIKRGHIVMIVGAVLIIAAFGIAYSVMPTTTSGVGGNFFLGPENLFDSVTENQRIEPGTTFTFSHNTATSQVPLMWGLHILDYQQDDRVSISISNTFGDKFGSFDEVDPIFIKSFVVPKVDTYNFYVENKGKESVTVVML